MPSVMTVQEFAELHGDWVFDPETHWRIYEDGARQEHSGSGMGVWEDPPANEYERAKRIERYCQLVLDEHVLMFRNYKQNLSYAKQAAARYKNPAMLPDKDVVVSELKRLKGMVNRANKRYTEAKLHRESVQPHWVTQREQQAARTQAAINEFWASVSGIDI